MSGSRGSSDIGSFDSTAPGPYIYVPVRRRTTPLSFSSSSRGSRTDEDQAIQAAALDEFMAYGSMAERRRLEEAARLDIPWSESSERSAADTSSSRSASSAVREARAAADVAYSDSLEWDEVSSRQSAPAAMRSASIVSEVEYYDLLVREIKRKDLKRVGNILSFTPIVTIDPLKSALKNTTLAIRRKVINAWLNS